MNRDHARGFFILYPFAFILYGTSTNHEHEHALYPLLGSPGRRWYSPHDHLGDSFIMKIPEDTAVIITVRKDWANNQGVAPFLHPESTQVRDDSRVILAKTLDLENPVGVWVRLLRRKDDTKQPNTILIPWREVITVVMGPAAEEPKEPEQQKSTIGFRFGE